MNDDPGAWPAGLSGGPGGLSGGPGGALDGSWPAAVDGAPDQAPDPPGARPRHIVFVAWRDLASRQAGGSEVLVDQLACGLLARGHRVTLLCGGQVDERPYQVVRTGGTYSQFLRAPLAYLRDFS